jgi:hypothetical protein
MAWIVRLVSIGAEGEEHGTDVMRIARPDDLTDLASLGLTLAEGKPSRLPRACRCPRRPNRQLLPRQSW